MTINNKEFEKNHRRPSAACESEMIGAHILTSIWWRHRHAGQPASPNTLRE
jgi:hypothetical protein